MQLYALSHNLAEVREFHTAIDLSRLDSRVNDASLRITSTRKRIHTLTRPPPITGTSFPYYLENPSRRGAPFAALEPHRRWRSSGYRLLKVGPGRGPADDRVLGVLFSVKARGQGRYDWREGSERGRVLGYETFVQGLCQMQIVEGLERGSRDLLVAAWCLRVYSEVLDGVPRPGGKCWLWSLLGNGADCVYADFVCPSWESYLASTIKAIPACHATFTLHELPCRFVRRVTKTADGVCMVTPERWSFSKRGVFLTGFLYDTPIGDSYSSSYNRTLTVHTAQGNIRSCHFHWFQQ